MSMAFFYSFFLTNFEIKNKHFLDTSPGYESVPTDPHPNQERWQHSDNRVSRKRGGENDFKMWCFLVNKGQPELNSRLVIGGWALLYQFWLGWRKGDWKQAASGASAGTTSPILTGCCARLLPPSSLIFNKTMPHRPPHPQLKEQGTGSPGTAILCSAWHAPHSLGEILHPKTGLCFPLKCRELQRKGAELYRRVPHTQSPFTGEEDFQKN